jgi:hypothetical protein
MIRPTRSCFHGVPITHRISAAVNICEDKDNRTEAGPGMLRYLILSKCFLKRLLAKY